MREITNKPSQARTLSTAAAHDLPLHSLSGYIGSCVAQVVLLSWYPVRPYDLVSKALNHGSAMKSAGN
ncbi:Vegetative incompatibility protein HET-E-1 [Fusarium oxysporum f. sp. albedinis]|nr:Vegetative incompatibility protein HET-E-1 [Fusarium oxysporum f. sp. albedinis]